MNISMAKYEYGDVRFYIDGKAYAVKDKKTYYLDPSNHELENVIPREIVEFDCEEVETCSD